MNNYVFLSVILFKVLIFLYKEGGEGYIYDIVIIYVI